MLSKFYNDVMQIWSSFLYDGKNDSKRFLKRESTPSDGVLLESSEEQTKKNWFTVIGLQNKYPSLETKVDLCKVFSIFYTDSSV
jgi:hypothetical protein